jgi:hypothetical protein
LILSAGATPAGLANCIARIACYIACSLTCARSQE